MAAHRWVALKHEIVYRKPAFLEDDVIATVLLEKVQGVRAFYETIIRRGEEVLAEIKSSWCCLDASTLRPTRLADHIIERFFPASHQPDQSSTGRGSVSANAPIASQVFLAKSHWATELVFQDPDLGAHGGLREVQVGSCDDVTAGFHDLEKRAGDVDVHGNVRG